MQLLMSLSSFILDHSHIKSSALIIEQVKEVLDFLSKIAQSFKISFTYVSELKEVFRVNIYQTTSSVIMAKKSKFTHSEFQFVVAV